MSGNIHPGKEGALTRDIDLRSCKSEKALGKATTN